MSVPSNVAEEFRMTMAAPRLWLLLGWFDIRQRYRRSTLGPIWLTISTALLVGTLGALWSTLFKLDVKDYVPYFAIAHVVWGFMVMQINESCNVFTQFEHIIKQTRLPIPVYIFRLLTRNIIIFAHNAVVILFVITFIGAGWKWSAFIFIPGFLALSVFLLGLSIVVGIACTRYRDLQPIVQNLTSIAFFITPIMWRPEALGRHGWVAAWNPISYLIEVVRAPLLGVVPSMHTWMWVAASIVATWALALLLLSIFRNRIVYWL